MFDLVGFDGVVEVVDALQAHVISADSHVVWISHQRVKLAVYILRQGTFYNASLTNS